MTNFVQGGPGFNDVLIGALGITSQLLGFLLAGKIPMERRKNLPPRWVRWITAAAVCLVGLVLLRLWNLGGTLFIILGAFLLAANTRTWLERWDETSQREEPRSDDGMT